MPATARTEPPITAGEIDRFWKKTLAQTAKERRDVQVEKLDEPLPFEKYRVTYRSLNGVRIRAYLAKPTGPTNARRRYPALIMGPGYGGTAFGHTLGECQRGCVVLQVYQRSQGESAQFWTVDPPSMNNWINYGKEKPEGFYYQGALADMVRGIDYLVSRTDVDPRRIGALGVSQGGFLALGTGAIDPRIKTVVAHLPFLCDLQNNATFQSRTSGGYFGPRKRCDPKLLTTFAYFHPVNLARRIRVPVLLSSGGKDAICPPETIRAVYDQLTGIKTLCHYPDLDHSPSCDFYEMTWTWMRQYLL